MQASFIFICVVLLAVCVVTLFWSQRASKNQSDELARANEEVRKGLAAELQQLQDEAASGNLPQAELVAAQKEIARRLGIVERDIALKSGAVSTEAETGLSRTVLVSAVAMVLGTVVLYAFIGNPTYEDRPVRLTAQIGANGNPVEQEIALLVARVEKRLEAQPDDLEGWSVIAPIYMRLKRFNEAAKAYETSAALTLDDDAKRADFLARQADAILLGNKGQFSELVLKIANDAITIDPDNPRAALIEAQALTELGDVEGAQQAWRSIVERFDGNSGIVKYAKETLDKLNLPLVANKEQAAAIQALGEDDRQAAIEGMVASLAARLEEEPNDKEGWLRLIRSYVVLGQRSKAQKSYEAAKMQFADNKSELKTIESLASDLNLN